VRHDPFDTTSLPANDTCLAKEVVVGKGIVTAIGAAEARGHTFLFKDLLEGSMYRPIWRLVRVGDGEDLVVAWTSVFLVYLNAFVLVKGGVRRLVLVRCAEEFRRLQYRRISLSKLR